MSFEKPTVVTDLDLAFPATVMHLMPPYDEIPEEFKSWGARNKWGTLVSMWFSFGLKKLELAPKEGIDQDVALRHIRTIIGSFQPKHEHKIAGCAFLMSKWFEDAKYEPNEINFKL